MLSLEQRFFLLITISIYTDKMSMAAGVEVRVPFLDPDLLEFASQIPPQFKQRVANANGYLKKLWNHIFPRR